MMRLGRHGGMASSELEGIITRSSNFLSVCRAENGAGLYNSVNGKYLGGVGVGWLPEYSRNLVPKYDCKCTPGGNCRSGSHGIYLVRGWRNIIYDLVALHRINKTREIVRVLGSEDATKAFDYGLVSAPMNDPSPSWNHSSL